MVVDLKAEYGETLPEVTKRVRRLRGKPCSVCGLIQRHTMNWVVRDVGYAELATGHNLGNEVAVLFGNVLHRQLGTSPGRLRCCVSTGRGSPARAKPFRRLHERETVAYALTTSIDQTYDELLSYCINERLTLAILARRVMLAVGTDARAFRTPEVTI